MMKMRTTTTMMTEPTTVGGGDIMINICTKYGFDILALIVVTVHTCSQRSRPTIICLLMLMVACSAIGMA